MLSSFSELLGQLKKRFFRKDKNKTPPKEDRDFVLAACQAWFSEYMRSIQLLGVPPEIIVALNENFGILLRTAGTATRRTVYIESIQTIEKIFNSFYADAQVVEWQQARNPGHTAETGVSGVVAELLAGVDTDLSTRYQQVIRDLSESERISYTGTAGELREILRIVLHTKAPEEEVRKQEWFTHTRQSARSEEEKKRGPTHAERVRYILEAQRRTSQKDLANAQANQELIDTMLGQVARSSYDRMSSRVHGQSDKREIIRSLQYINALAVDLLQTEK